MAPRPLIVIAALLLSLGTSRPTMAWNHTGHRVVATIAYDELTPATRAKLDALLKAHPRYEADLLAWMPDGYDQSARFAFGMSAFWPDIIRNPDNPMHFTHHRPQWHFINLRYQLRDWRPAPATAPTTGAAVASSTQPLVDGPRDIVEAIARCRADLRDPTLSDAEKAVAICWLAHLVGDVHQPLHAATLYSAQFPEGDRGGNRFIVSVYREQMNLHAVWDQLLGTQSSALIIDYFASSIRNDPRFVRRALPEVDSADATRWVAESHEIAKTVVYREGTLQGANSDAVRDDPTIIVPTLPEGYLRNAEEVAVRRIALAGHRLAEMLNEALAE